MSTRTHLVTGSASGIGKSLTAKLRAQGDTVIGVDIHDADIVVDLTTAEGRAALVEQATALSGGHLDTIVAVAGLATPVPATVGVNYFGAIATLEGLRPLLAGSSAPRAAVVASIASLMPSDPDLIDLMVAGDEDAALARAAELATDPVEGNKIYASSKNAVVRWLRTAAPSSDWAGAGIPINAIGPGVVLTPMTADLRKNEEELAALMQMVPMPLNGPMEPEACADLLEWLVSPANTHVTGQVVYIDGGFDAVVRGAAAW